MPQKKIVETVPEEDEDIPSSVEPKKKIVPEEKKEKASPLPKKTEEKKTEEKKIEIPKEEKKEKEIQVEKTIEKSPEEDKKETQETEIASFGLGYFFGPDSIPVEVEALMENMKDFTNGIYIYSQIKK